MSLLAVRLIIPSVAAIAAPPRIREDGVAAQATIPFLNASISAAVTFTMTGLLTGPPTASRSGTPPRAPADATCWPDCACFLPAVLSSASPFFVGSPAFLSSSFFSRPSSCRRSRVRTRPTLHCDLGDRLHVVGDVLVVARRNRRRARQFLALDLLLDGRDAVLDRRMRREHAVLVGAATGSARRASSGPPPVRWRVAQLAGELNTDFVGLSRPGGELVVEEVVAQPLGGFGDQVVGRRPSSGGARRNHLALLDEADGMLGGHVRDS